MFVTIAAVQGNGYSNLYVTLGQIGNGGVTELEFECVKIRQLFHIRIHRMYTDRQFLIKFDFVLNKRSK